MSRRMSVFISRFLNDLGYSHEMVKFRQQANAALGENDDYVTSIRCGSKREGLTLLFENDVDVMTIINGIDCYEQFEHINAFNPRTTFQIERLATTAQGYALLRCISNNKADGIAALVQESLVEIQGVLYLSSDSWRQNAKGINKWYFSSTGWETYVTSCRDNEGPSSPIVASNGISADTVLAIRCHCPQLIFTWRTRRRLHDWPSPELINTVASLDCHVVPIGYKNSPVQFLEWRICFTKGEICLIESLNDCQTKLIVLLKLIGKHVLKPICKEVTSYTMKNLVLWMSEKYPTRLFAEQKLMPMLRHSLKMLKQCIMNRKLPSYMIEQRNLLVDRLSDSHVMQLSGTIDMLLQEGPRMLFRCPKIRDGLNTFRLTPDQFYMSARIRRRIEPILVRHQQFSVDHGNRIISNDPLTSANEIVRSCMFSGMNEPSLPQFTVDDIFAIMPDFFEIIVRGDNIIMIMEEFMDRVKKYLS